MNKISRFLRPSLLRRAPVTPPSEEELQRLVYNLVHDRLLSTLGPGGTFAVTIRHTDDDAFFAQTFAESIAREVASTLRSPVLATDVLATTVLATGARSTGARSTGALTAATPAASALSPSVIKSTVLSSPPRSSPAIEPARLIA